MGRELPLPRGEGIGEQNEIAFVRIQRVGAGMGCEGPASACQASRGRMPGASKAKSVRRL